MRVVVEGLAHRFPGTDLLFEHLDFVAEPGSTMRYADHPVVVNRHCCRFSPVGRNHMPEP